MRFITDIVLTYFTSAKIIISISTFKVSCLFTITILAVYWSLLEIMTNKLLKKSQGFDHYTALVFIRGMIII